MTQEDIPGTYTTHQSPKIGIHSQVEVPSWVSGVSEGDCETSAQSKTENHLRGWAHIQARTHGLWFGQQKQKQLCTSENPTIPLFGFGPVTSIIGQGAWEDSSPHVYQVIDIQTSVLGIDPEGVHKLSLAFLCHGLGDPECKPVKLNQTVNPSRACDWASIPATDHRQSGWHSDEAGEISAYNPGDPEGRSWY